MKAIGGYPELELRKGVHYHKNAIRLNTARNCLEYILLARKYHKVYVPDYTCDAIFEPFNKTILYDKIILYDKPEKVSYNIDEKLDPTNLPDLKEDEAFLYTNYFGLKQNTVERLAEIYKGQLIIDNSQAFFDKPLDGIDTFYSARKFFGVPDGAYLYTDAKMDCFYYPEFKEDRSYERVSALLKRIDISAEDGYEDFKKTEGSLCCQPIKKMSKLTEAILCSIDYGDVCRIRRDNYKTLYWKLFQKQSFRLDLSETAVPLCYPFLASSSDIRKKLIENKIYVPTYWPNVMRQCDSTTIEHRYAMNMIPLPIDQRYNQKDMKRISNIILDKKI